MMWRRDLAETINATNEQLGIAVHWEHRSFKEQGIDKEPTIHIGAVANALERKGIQTERGNINREIIRGNVLLEQAKEMLELARVGANVLHPRAVETAKQYNVPLRVRSGETEGQIGLADCQRKISKKNIRQNSLTVSRQCGEIHCFKKDRQL